MPKSVKGNAGRTPPEPSASHAEIDAWIATLVPHLQPVVQGLDESIRAAITDADRTRYVKITSLAETTQPELLDWIDQAARTPGWR